MCPRTLGAGGPVRGHRHDRRVALFAGPPTWENATTRGAVRSKSRVSSAYLSSANEWLLLQKKIMAPVSRGRKRRCNALQRGALFLVPTRKRLRPMELTPADCIFGVAVFDRCGKLYLVRASRGTGSCGAV